MGSFSHERDRSTRSCWHRKGPGAGDEHLGAERFSPRISRRGERNEPSARRLGPNRPAL
jgi:hypothetical protein